VGWLCVRALVRLRRGDGAGLRRGVPRLAALAGALWLAFLTCWGLNYQREPFATSAGLDVRPATLAELSAVCEELVDAANQLREGLPEDRRGAMKLRDGRPAALARVAKGYAGVASRYPFLGSSPGRPKMLFSSSLFSHLGVTGIYFPFSGEPGVNVTLPDVELPFSAAHEMAHRLGFAREDEANFLGYLACRLHPERDVQYAGILAASRHALAALAPADRAAHDRLAARRTASVQHDLEALAEWSRRYQGRAALVSRAVNDAYLRSQGESRGVASYGRMVDLLVYSSRTGGS
jgi:hypothetical protein